MHMSFKGIIALDTPAMIAWTCRKEEEEKEEEGRKEEEVKEEEEESEHDNKSGPGVV